MQINTDAIKKIVNDLSLNRKKAFLPNTCPKLTAHLFNGGVSGKVKEKRPIATAEAIEK